MPLIRRFEAWRIDSRRAGEFHRTWRDVPRPWLLERPMPEPWTCATPTVLRMQGQPRYKRPGFDRGELARCRPEARRAPPDKLYAAGPLRCVPLKRWLSDAVWIDSLHGRYPRGRPPVSAAPHRLLAMGYFDIPFLQPTPPLQEQ